jgi:cytosine/adenosine deaminase-related metal-dependent hydrolase
MSDRFGTERILITGGTLLTMDADLGDFEGDLLIENGIIVAAGPNLDPAGARVIDARDHYVLPGFIDTHRHTWQSVLRFVGSDWSLGQYFIGMHFGMSKHYRPEDTYAANLLGTVEALDSGITTLLDWSHGMETPEHADAGIQALFDSGSRVVFAHGGGATMWTVPSATPHTTDIRRVRERYFTSDDQLVTLAFAARGPQFTTEEVSVHDFELARELGLRVSVHVGDGAWGRMRPVEWMHDRGYTGDHVTYVHCNTISDEEFQLIAATGGSASVSADIETQMGHGWPATGRLLDAGVRPSLSIDACSSNGGDMFHAMKTTISTQRALDNATVEAGGQTAGLRLNCKDVLEFATIQGARAAGIDHRVGSLTVGKEADVILIRADDLSMVPRNNPYGAIVYGAHAGMVDTILVAGRVVKEHGRLTSVDTERVKRLALETNDHLFEAALTDPTIADATRDGRWQPGVLLA